MSISTELASWFSPEDIELSPSPQVGDKAPSSPKLVLPAENRKPTIISFLRHCGCPDFSVLEVAEAAFRALRTAAAQHPDINFVAVSHSDQQSTNKWLEAIGGPSEADSSSSVAVVVDAERQVYAQWGLGTVSWGHVFSPSGLLGVWRLGKEQGIWNRPTESGTRWQSSGNWAVDEEGYVRWGGPAARADDVIDVAAATSALQEPRARD